LFSLTGNKNGTHWYYSQTCWYLPGLCTEAVWVSRQCISHWTSTNDKFWCATDCSNISTQASTGHQRKQWWNRRLTATANCWIA